MYRLFIKRALDLFLSILIMPVFIIILVPISILIKLEDRGPLFYKAKRLGKDKKTYNMYKFRSMKVNAPDIRNDDGSTYNSNIDPRVTKIGKKLRETSIDELPQILNVLKGDMSIIGPRPGLPDLLEDYKEDEISKLDVRPGITGYTQAYYRNSLSNREKRLKDASYAKKLNIIVDVKILFKTFITVIKRDGLYSNKNTIEIEEDINKK